VTYILLATEYREATIATMAGVVAIWAFGVLSPKEMIAYVDLNAIGLLFGTMIIVGALSEAHFFQWIGFSLANLCGRRPTHLMVVFTLLTGGLSALLPNVTTVLFMVAMTIEISELVGLNPIPYVISEILASNIGGAATLIGDPPNIMIATATGFTFVEFLANIGLISLTGLFVSLAYVWMVFRNRLRNASTPTPPQNSPTALLKMPNMKDDTRLLWTGLAALAGSVLLFTLQDIVGIYPTTTALVAAIILLFVGGPKMADILRDVEWNTLIFFGSLFIIVGALEKTGWMNYAAQVILSLFGTNLTIGVTASLWLMSLISAVINNIPFAAAFIPVLKAIGSSGLNVYPFWWALAAGTGLGGNGTIIGASSNVIAIGLARAKGVRITFLDFAKVGMAVLVLTTAVANLILLLKLWVG
jgi:Na+/H+ antiporter NhaD/arsenite permease-like protein